MAFSTSSLFRLGILVALVTGFFPFPAFAAGECNAAGGVSLFNIFCNLTYSFQNVPKALAIFSYAIGVILTLTGLLNLRNYGDDPSQTPLRSIVMKFALAALLIGLPLAMRTFIGTVTNKGVNADEVVYRSESYDGNSLLNMRKKK